MVAKTLNFFISCARCARPVPALCALCTHAPLLCPPSQSGTEVLAVGAEGTGKLIFWLWEGVKTLFHPMCLYSKYSKIYGEFNHA